MPEELLREIREEQVRQGEQIKTLFKQQEDQKKLTESVYKLTSSVEKLTTCLDSTDKKVDKLSEDMEGIKEKPAKRWDSAVSLVITIVITALVTYALTRIGLG